MTGRHAAATHIDDAAVADQAGERPPAHRADSGQDAAAAPAKKPAGRRAATPTEEKTP
jgi:hypothetical protein